MFNQDFREFIESLNANHVRYLVVGGYAAALHGHPRYPNQVIQIGFPPDRIDILTSASGVEFAECYEQRAKVSTD